MIKLRNFLRRFGVDQSAATAIEYGLIAALIAATCIGALLLLSEEMRGMFGMSEQTIEALRTRDDVP